MPPAFKPAYLIHGDDHGRLAERRARLRELAERESGPSGVEVFEGETCTPDAVAAALSAMTFAMGRRFVIAEGVERWKEAEVEVLAPVMRSLPEDTTVTFFAREEGKTTAPKALHDLVRKAGGDIAEESAVKPWELPKWAVARAAELGLTLDQAAAKALVHRVGERQQRLLRELEKLALELGPGAKIDADDVEELTAGSAERKIWSLADALLARDRGRAMARYLELRESGERLPGLLYSMTRRLREALDVVSRLEAGESESQVRSSLRMPSKAASAFIADARGTDSARLRRALERLADLEVVTRGGGTLTEDTAALRAIAAIAA